MRRVVVATRNPGKLRELEALARAHGLPLSFEGLTAHPGVPEVEEDQDSFAGNARKKAREVARATGLPALADDSGLCVDALGGAPGVYSARYAPGPDAARVQKLLGELASVPAERRAAHFACALCLALPGGPEVAVEGRCSGRIGQAPRGSQGFGYDPVFELPDGRTLAELSPAEKDALSHRGRAFLALLPHLAELARK